MTADTKTKSFTINLIVMWYGWEILLQPHHQQHNLFETHHSSNQLRVLMVHGISWLTTQKIMGKSKPYRSIHCSFFTPTKKIHSHHSSCFIIDKKNFAGCLKHLYKSSLALPVLNLASSLINLWRFEFSKVISVK